MAQSKILIVATSAAQMTNGEQTGIWLEELTTPLYAFLDAGAEVTLASVKGGEIPIDQRSIAPAGENDDSVERYLKDQDAQARVAVSVPLADILEEAEAFDAVFLPGGHGTMFDYPESPELTHLIELFDRAGKVVSAVCHGPAGLVSALAADGQPLVRGRRIAAFTDSEEHAVGLQEAVPFLLETKLRSLGAQISAAPDFQAHAVRDGLLITGQNPASAKDTAALVMQVLSEKAAA